MTASNTLPNDKSRCTLCGAPRIPLNREKTKFGACTLIGCPDPLHDYEAEKEEINAD